MKQLWKTVNELKTPERRLLFGLMLVIIVVLWMSFRDNNSDRVIRINELEKELVQVRREKETQRILLQDKIDQLNEKIYTNLEQYLKQTEDLKQSVKNMK